MRIQERTRTITLKIVYCGPGLSGKTTNIRRLHEGLAPAQRGPLIQLDTEAERTLFFDYFPSNLGQLGGYTLRAHVFTVPGQSFYQRTRAGVLKGADGVVFVADSSPGREVANQRALAETRAQLDAQACLVFQWNKRDLPEALPVRTLERALNPEGRPAFEASAFHDRGVERCYNALLQTLLSALREAGVRTAAS